MTRLWFDDVRPAPEGWVWARTVAEAQKILLEYEVSECSLDHDLGFNNVLDAGIDINDVDALVAYVESLPDDLEEETGMDLVDWMIEHNKVPPTITIHSWNPTGALNMATRFVNSGYDCVIAPFKVVNE